MKRWSILGCALLAAAATLAWYGWRQGWWGGSPAARQAAQAEAEADAVIIEKAPVDFTLRTFDPANPPADMPPLAPGEKAVCDSNFGVNALVAGRAEPTDATDAIATVTRVTVKLALQVTVWVPDGASAHVIDHEQGHRRISEHFYESAERMARQIAAPYVGKQTLITFQAGGGESDLNAQLGKALQEMGSEISDEYGKELNPEATQLRYDDITDHARNDVAAQDAIAQAVKETEGAGTGSATATPGN